MGLLMKHFGSRWLEALVRRETLLMGLMRLRELIPAGAVCTRRRSTREKLYYYRCATQEGSCAAPSGSRAGPSAFCGRLPQYNHLADVPEIARAEDVETVPEETVCDENETLWTPAG